MCVYVAGPKSPALPMGGWHFEATGRKYPLCVKLGTLSPKGGDVFSYAADEDDMVEDPKLAEHLSHWGINLMQQTKTEKRRTGKTRQNNKTKETQNRTAWRSSTTRTGMNQQKFKQPTHSNSLHLGACH